MVKTDDEVDRRNGAEEPEDDSEIYEDDDEEDEDGEEGEESELEPEPPRNPRLERAKIEGLFRKMQAEPVLVRVHDVIVKGNKKTKDYIIEAETAPLRDAATMQELLEASKAVNFRLQSLDIFDSVKITLDKGPPELPGTANVIVDVVETGNPLSGEIGAYTKGEARSSTVEATLKYKNIFGHGDLWDGSLACDCDHVGEVSAGVYVPARFRGVLSPLTARVYLLSQDWLKFSSFKERTFGVSLGLLSTRYHEVGYNLGWRVLTDPSHMASQSIRRQLGHGLLSSLKYTFKVDRRNSSSRPTRGYSFISNTQVGGIAPDSRCLRFLRQEIDLRCAIPLGFYRAALNIGMAAGVVFPWGNGFQNMQSPVPERFFLGGNLSPVCTLGGPTALWGFRSRGLGPTEPRRQTPRDASDGDADPGRDFLGGDLAVTAFADLSFDFPLEWLKAKGLHGHIFASAGNVEKLTENAYRNFSLRSFAESSRSSIGCGIVVPTSLFRMELNYCYLLKKSNHDRGKSGFRISFST